MATPRTEKYVTLINNYLANRITAEEFERGYLAAFKSEPAGMTLAEYAVLETLFTAVDAYCPDSSIRSDEDLDEGQLRQAAHNALDQLLKL